MRAPTLVAIILWGALASWLPRTAEGQSLALTDRSPRFLFASTPTAARVEIDVNRSAVLRRIVSLRVDNPTIGSLLAVMERQADLTIAYGEGLPVDRPVPIRADSISVGTALTVVLLGSGYDVVLSPRGNLSLEPKSAPVPSVQQGTVSGQVIDERTSNPLAGATISLEPGARVALTVADGRYRFAGVDTGSYTVRARYIGYAPIVAAVTVRKDEQATVNFRLTKSVQQLNDVVTTGTVIPTEVRALPSPVSVISERDIALQRPQTVQEVFRQVVPGGLSWDVPQYPYLTAFSTRGASTLSPGSGQMKIFVDGIESAEIGTAAFDPNSIERIEVIRGPQAAAIYGSEAIGGVIQIFTKRGDPNLNRPQGEAQASLGLVQTPYDGYGGVLRQNYMASVRSGSSDVSYNLGAGYMRLADYLPNGEQSSQSNPSVYGGVRLSRGILDVDVSARYWIQEGASVVNPELSQTGFALYSKPLFQPSKHSKQTVGARLTLMPTHWLRHMVTMGIDRFDSELVQSRPRLTTPADTFLNVDHSDWRKMSVGFNTSVQSSLGAEISGSLTAGFDYWSLPTSRWFTSGALSTGGTIETDPGQPVTASQTSTSNTGYFGQGQVGFHDALFLTVGLRAEENSNFGDSLGTPLSPRVGLSYVRPVGDATVKLRGSWGRAIRAPTPGLKLGVVTPTSVTLANSDLGPERQRGWDVGVDAVFGGRGSLSLTYYDQVAENLIQFVELQAEPVVTNQWQNIGGARNTGVEVEGSLSLGEVRLTAQYGYARARISQLAPGYTGDLRVNDQSLATPRHTAGALFSAVPRPGTHLSTGLTYVGSFRQTDFLALFRCFGGTGPCSASSRDYIVQYPGFIKVNAGVSQDLSPFVSGFVAVDNVFNSQAYELFNIGPVTGRTTTVGLRLRY